MTRLVGLSVVIMLVAARSVSASVQEYTSKTLWEQNVSSFTTLTFMELPVDTLITNQYSSEGVVFTDGSDFIYSCSCFLNDGVGVNGAFDTIALSFSEPTYSIAADYPGLLKISLYSQGQFIYASSDFTDIVSHFAGLISTEPFDSALIIDPAGGVVIDDLHFGPVIPAPGALGPLAAAVLMPRTRRRGQVS